MLRVWQANTGSCASGSVFNNETQAAPLNLTMLVHGRMLDAGQPG
jgi:hypothetical protein